MEPIELTEEEKAFSLAENLSESDAIQSLHVASLHPHPCLVKRSLYRHALRIGLWLEQQVQQLTAKKGKLLDELVYWQKQHHILCAFMEKNREEYRESRENLQRMIDGMTATNIRQQAEIGQLKKERDELTRDLSEALDEDCDGWRFTIPDAAGKPLTIKIC